MIGRSPGSTLRLTGPQVSGTHAELQWDGGVWSIQDLGSRNGTLVDRKRLSPGERIVLRGGEEIHFGAAGERFALIDAGPPQLMAISAAGDVALSPSNMMSLPSEEQLELTIYEDVDGRWWAESNDEVRAVEDRANVVAGGVSWSLYLPTTLGVTRDAQTPPLVLGDLALELRVSLDEEHVSVRLHQDGNTLTLEPRVHAFLLLTLARARLEDREQDGLPASEHGWRHRDDLTNMLKIEPYLLNLWVFRARQQLAKAGVLSAAQLVERRADSEQLRIGIERLKVRSA